MTLMMMMMMMMMMQTMMEMSFCSSRQHTATYHLNEKDPKNLDSITNNRCIRRHAHETVTHRHVRAAWDTLEQLRGNLSM